MLSRYPGSIYMPYPTSVSLFRIPFLLPEGFKLQIFLFMISPLEHYVIRYSAPATFLLTLSWSRIFLSCFMSFSHLQTYSASRYLLCHWTSIFLFGNFSVPREHGTRVSSWLRFFSMLIVQPEHSHEDYSLLFILQHLPNRSLPYTCQSN